MVDLLLCATGTSGTGGVEGPGRGEVSVERADEFENAPEEEKSSSGGGGDGFIARELGREVWVRDEGGEEANVSVRGDKRSGGIVGG